MIARPLGTLLTLLMLGGVVPAASAEQVELQRDQVGVAALPDFSPHWVWVNDIAFFNMADGRSYLLDADSGAFVGMLSTGLMWAKFVVPSDYSALYSPETYYSRGTRGERTDVLTFYNPTTLAVDGEVLLPPKIHSGVPNIGFSTITDNNRFVLVYNFNPAQSVSIVDVQKRRLVEEISTGGCALVYGSGERQFIMMCGNGSLMEVTLGEDGTEMSRKRTQPFFEPGDDPVMDKPVRMGDVWYFVSYAGRVHPVNVSGATPEFLPSFSLTGRKERNWRPGGIQVMAAHAGRNELYVLMHEGGMDTHKWPGTELWVFDAGNGKRLRKITLGHPLLGIVATPDAEPLLIGTYGELPMLDVFDIASGSHLRTIEFVAQTPLYLHAMPGGQ